MGDEREQALVDQLDDLLVSGRACGKVDYLVGYSDAMMDLQKLVPTKGLVHTSELLR